MTLVWPGPQSTSSSGLNSVVPVTVVCFLLYGIRIGLQEKVAQKLLNNKSSE
jgi:hypothetical protein